MTVDVDIDGGAEGERASGRGTGPAQLHVGELTARGAGAVSVLAVLGPGALGRVVSLARGRTPRVGRATLVELRDPDGPLDEVLVVAHSAERIELHLHGSRPIVRRVAALLVEGPAGAPHLPEEGAQPPAEGAGGRAGTAQLAGPPGGEAPAVGFERLAWLRLPGAPCEAAARVLLDQAEGALTRELERLAAAPPAEQLAGARALAARGRRLAPLFEPARVVLAGPVNAGKSTLFNALVGRRRVIVSGSPGTTRDAITERALLGAYAVLLCDTAGERSLAGGGAAEELERRGQGRARAARAAADLVLWLEPADGGGGQPAAPAGERRVVLESRVDLSPRRPGFPAAPGAVPGIAALPDPEGARRVVREAFLGAFGLPREPWEPGSAVPFERALWIALERAAVAGGDDLRRALRACLAGDPAPAQQAIPSGPAERAR